MTELLLVVAVMPVLLAAYTYVGYPLFLKVIGAFKPYVVSSKFPGEWPVVSITVPAYNEQSSIGDTIEALLAIDYPVDRRQILVVSDGSTDNTDEIVLQYRDRGVELYRLRERCGKTRAENAAIPRLRGDIIVNTDATSRIHPQAVKLLVAALQDPSVGVASGRDVSGSFIDADINLGESGYVGYEMWVRDLETRAGGIIGASGCLYAIRANLHVTVEPATLSRDFAASLNAAERGYRAVSVRNAVCLVARTPSLRIEYRRKVRTIARGMETLRHRWAAIRPLRNRWFAWKLFSHKVCRWTLPWTGVLSTLALIALSFAASWPLVPLAVILVGGAVSLIGWLAPDGTKLARPISVAAYAAIGNISALHASVKSLSRATNQIWEPTRRRAAGGGK